MKDVCLQRVIFELLPTVNESQSGFATLSRLFRLSPIFFLSFFIHVFWNSKSDSYTYSFDVDYTHALHGFAGVSWREDWARVGWFSRNGPHPPPTGPGTQLYPWMHIFRETAAWFFFWSQRFLIEYSLPLWDIFHSIISVRLQDVIFWGLLCCDQDKTRSLCPDIRDIRKSLVFFLKNEMWGFCCGFEIATGGAGYF